MLGTFEILDFGIGICLPFRAWNFKFEEELCSGGVYPRLAGGHGTRPLNLSPLIERTLFSGQIQMTKFKIKNRSELRLHRGGLNFELA